MTRNVRALWGFMSLNETERHAYACGVQLVCGEAEKKIEGQERGERLSKEGRKEEKREKKRSLQD